MIVKSPTVVVRPTKSIKTLDSPAGQRALGDYLREHRRMQREMHAGHPTAKPWLVQEPK